MDVVPNERRYNASPLFIWIITRIGVLVWDEARRNPYDATKYEMTM